MNWNLLHKYLSEECKPEEMQKVEDWLRADKRNQQFMDSLVKIWDVMPEDEIEVSSKKAWDSFKGKLTDEKSALSTSAVSRMGKTQSDSSQSTTLRKRYGRVIAMALSAAAVVLIAFLFYQYASQMMGVGASNVEAPQVRRISTERGQRTTFRLIDGTRIQLNSNSTIEVPPEFNDSTRIVRLEGEGFFEVAHDSTKPFVVQSENAYTRVLGTKFGVRAYSDEDQVQVVVAEGRVALGSTKQPSSRDEVLLTRNQKGTISQTGATEVTGVDNVDVYLGWKDGKLVFNNRPLSEVVPDLERWYDIDITLQDTSIASRRLKARFNKESLTEVLNVIALSLNIEYERDRKKIIFEDK